MAISEDFIYQLKNANSIESVMSSYTHLNKRGHNYVCLCPFHSEKTPSCTVYPDTQSFYCYGCGAGGDVITFVMKSENLDYIEALRYLAEKSGIAFPENDNDKQDKHFKLKQRIFEMNRLSANFYFSQLKSKQGEKGLAYLINRGLRPETIKKYGIGFAENQWRNLKDFLKSKGYLEDEMVAAGLCLRSRTGNVFDVFRNRIIFPIVDLRGNVVAFGGRLIDGDGPKYLNSSDTPVFKKSRNLFSLNFAKTSNEKKLILAEGYMDVIAVNQAGIDNVVATLGTALTPEQARLMSQYAEEIIISYDSDEAGQKATNKAIKMLSEVGLKTKILKINNAKDPDEFIKKFGATRFKLLLENSEGAIAFKINKCKDGIDLESDFGKVEFLKRVTNVLSEIISPIEREIYISRVSNDQGVSKQVLTTEVNAIIKKRSRSNDKRQWRNITNSFTQNKDVINPEAKKYPKQAKAENGIISFLFYNQDKFNEIISKISVDNFVTSFNRKVFSFLVDKLQNLTEISISSFNSEFSPKEMGKISEIISKSREIDITMDTINDYIDVLLLSDDKINENSDMSDEEFLDFSNKLKKSKTNHGM